LTITGGTLVSGTRFAIAGLEVNITKLTFYFFARTVATITHAPFEPHFLFFETFEVVSFEMVSLAKKGG